MYCKNCGKEISANQKFCPSCGTPQTVAPEAQPPVNVNIYSGGYEAKTGYEPNASYQPNTGYQPEPVPAAGPLATDRSLLMYILLSIVTCGIYGFYFLYCLARDVNVACDGDGETTPGLGKLILLSLVTCGIYSYYWYYKLGNRLAANAPRYGMNFQETGTTVLIWCLVGLVLYGIGAWVAMWILIKNTNAICEAYNEYVSR